MNWINQYSAYDRVPECASRTVGHTEHGIKCLSYKEVYG